MRMVKAMKDRSRKINSKKILSKIDTLSIGDLANYFLDNGIKKDLIQSVLMGSQNDEKKSERQWKVKEAYHRITLPLSRGRKVLYFFIPFGKFISPLEEGPKYLENGYFRCEKQFLIFSWLGLTFYILIIVLSKVVIG